MLHRLIDSLRHVAHPSGFETYLWKLQRDGRSGYPSVEEARKDYVASRGIGGHLVS